MEKQFSEYSSVMEKTRTIISHYHDIFASDINYVRSLLDTKDIPAETADVLRPIIDTILINKGKDSKNVFEKHKNKLNEIFEQIVEHNKIRDKELKVLESVLNSDEWHSVETQMARSFGLTLCTMEQRGLDITLKEIESSDFTLQDILSEFRNSQKSFLEFSKKWYADCTKHDYGEEWNPEEGNQQLNNQPPVILGMSQGFLVGYSLFFLYAKKKHESLLDFLKKSKTPSAKKVQKDILRIFKSLK